MDITDITTSETTTGTTGGQAMREERVPIPAGETSAPREVRILRFGAPGARPKAYLQAGLHADELPGMLVLKRLAETLAEAAARGEIVGEIVLVPVANPIGLAQETGEYVQGRFDAGTGRNFNRGFPDLAAGVAEAVAGALGDDADANVERIREAMRAHVRDLPRAEPVDHLQLALIGAACDADLVLDLHADNEAVAHMYTSAAAWPAMRDLAAEIDVRAVLLEDASGGEPFDESCAGPWPALAERFPDAPIPPACLAATLELRSNNSVDPGEAERWAGAIRRFLERRGVLSGAPGALPRLLCEPTPLRGAQQLKAGVHGLVVYHAQLGDTVRAGERIATVIPPEGPDETIEARTEGLLFARHDQRWAWPGKVIGKIAGAEPLPERTGHLLTD